MILFSGPVQRPCSAFSSEQKKSFLMLSEWSTRWRLWFAFQKTPNSLNRINWFLFAFRLPKFASCNWQLPLITKAVKCRLAEGNFSWTKIYLLSKVLSQKLHLIVSFAKHWLTVVQSLVLKTCKLQKSHKLFNCNLMARNELRKHRSKHNTLSRNACFSKNWIKIPDQRRGFFSGNSF